MRRIDRHTAMRILTALGRFARTGEGDVKRLQGNTNDLRLRVGDYRVRFIENPPAHSTFTPLCIAAKPTAERRLDPSPDAGRTWLERNARAQCPSCIRFLFDDGPHCGHAKPSGLGMVSWLQHAAGCATEARSSPLSCSHVEHEKKTFFS